MRVLRESEVPKELRTIVSRANGDGFDEIGKVLQEIAKQQDKSDEIAGLVLRLQDAIQSVGLTVKRSANGNLDALHGELELLRLATKELTKEMKRKREFVFTVKRDERNFVNKLIAKEI